MFLAIRKFPFLFLFAIFTAAFLSYLGSWQYEKGAQKEADLAKQAANKEQQIINLSNMTGTPFLEDGMPVHVDGQFLAHTTIFHDNRLNSGQAGYHVYSVFQFNQKSAVLVNRGWVKMNVDRSMLPVVQEITGNISLLGHIRYPVKNVYTLADEAVALGFPQRVQTIEVEDIQQSLNVQLVDFSILLNPAVVGPHYDRNWANLLPGKYMTADKHYAYSLQWFTLSLVALIVFMILIYKMASNEKRQS